MVYTVTLQCLVTTPYGVAIDRYNIGNVDEDAMPTIRDTAEQLGWSVADVRVSLHKDYLDSLVAESPVVR
jgi:hypothetical protein